MSILRHIVGVACELLTLKDPYDDHTYVPPVIIKEHCNRHGHVISQIVRAQNHSDATRHWDGHTVQGDRSVVATKIGRNLWDVHIEDWDNGPKSRGGMRLSEDFDSNAWAEDYDTWKKRKGR